MIYLDNAATTKVDDEVVKEMMPYFSEKYGNPGSVHSLGKEAKEILNNCRKKIANLINAEAEEIIFTSGATESDNIALQEIAYPNKAKGNHIVSTKFEHLAVLNTCQFLEKDGFNVRYVEPDEKGMINPKDIEKTLTDKTILVSVMHANNEIGTIQDIKEIGRICKDKNIYFHTDAVQTLGKITIDVKKMNIDLLSASSHKLHGPKGVGFLYIRKGVNIHPLVHGGDHEFGKRAGTENITGIVGMTKACEIAHREMTENSQKIQKLRDKLEKGILKLPNTKLNGHEEKRLPNISNISFTNVEGERLLMELNNEGICASSGSACTSEEKTSHVIVAMGKEFDEAYGAIRFSLSKFNTEREINEILEKLPNIIENSKAVPGKT